MSTKQQFSEGKIVAVKVVIDKTIVLPWYAVLCSDSQIFASLLEQICQASQLNQSDDSVNLVNSESVKTFHMLKWFEHVLFRVCKSVCS